MSTPLTPRELQVAQLLIEGCSNKTIAYTLGIHESTVKVYIRNGMKKTDTKNRVRYAIIVDRQFNRCSWPSRPGAIITQSDPLELHLKQHAN